MHKATTSGSLRKRQWGYVLAGAAVVLLLGMAGAAAPPKPDAAAAAAGRTLFQQDCSVCHLTDSTASKIGPGMKGLYSRPTLPVSHQAVTDANVRAQIENGNLNAKPVPMPPFRDKLSAKEMAEILAYLKTL